MNKVFSDPKRFGPGLWYNIHIKGKRAIDEKTKKEFVDTMYMYYEEFPCENCRRHIREYMDSHPFQPFWNMTNEYGRHIGMFKWAWMFHNAVNTRLHKPYMDWETALDMYNINGLIEPCTDCGQTESVPYYEPEQIIQGYFMQRGIPETLQRNKYY